MKPFGTPVGACIVSLFFVQHVSAHMRMQVPAPLHAYLGEGLDAPLFGGFGFTYPCKGFLNANEDYPVTATYQAGAQQTMQLANDVFHDGGSCQIVISDDNGATFKVLKSVIGSCPFEKQYDFTIPGDTPAGNYLLGWKWHAFSTDEIYMDCAYISVQGGSARAKRSQQRRRNSRIGPQSKALALRQQTSSYSSLPPIWNYDLPGSGCSLITNGQHYTTIPIYAEPGPDVEWGLPTGISNLNELSAPIGSCGDTSIYGHVPANLAAGNAESSGPSSGGGGGLLGSTVPPPARLPVPAPAPAPAPAPVSAPAPVPAPAPAAVAAPAPAPASSPTLPTSSASIPSPSLPSVVAPAPVPAAPLPAGALPTTTTGVDGCYPGSVLCTSQSTWSQCVLSSNTHGDYIAMGAVNTGMICMTHTLPMSLAPPGAIASDGSDRFVDDRIVQARPLGSCGDDQNGDTLCLTEGTGFALCVNGGYIDMGLVGAGRKCVDGVIVPG